MAATDPSVSLLVTGQLAYGCTDLSTAWPHGGTGLGLVGHCFFAPPAGVVRLPGGESNTSEKVLYVGGDAVFGCRVEGWSDLTTDGVLNAIFPNSVEKNSHDVLDWPGSDLAPGQAIATITKLVFTPRHSGHPALLLYVVSPLVEETAELRFSSYRSLKVPMLFVAHPDGTGRVAQMGRLADLTL